MATHGTVHPFHPAKEEWSTYIERLSFYFSANDVTTDEKKRSILLSNCGSATFKLVQGLVETPLAETAYDAIVDALQNHYEPKPSEIVERYKFYSRHREAGETIAAYVAVLRDLAKHCNYGDKLKEHLRDQLHGSGRRA